MNRETIIKKEERFKIDQPVYLSPPETDIYLLQKKFSDRLTKQFKKGNGVFFTPPEIIERLVALADININDKILDPACAVGQFLYYVIDRLVSEGKKKRLQNPKLSKVLSQNIYGMDINDEFVKECKKLLSDKIYKLLGTRIKPKISKADFLSVSPKKRFDVVIGNPPYGIPGYDPHYPIRLTREQKEHYKKLFKTWKGKYNLYALFVEQGLNLLKKRGRLCFIIPATFMILDEFKRFRKYLSVMGKVEIEYLGSGVFKNAQVSTVLLKVIKEGKGLTLKDPNGYYYKKESYQGELIRLEDDFTKTLEKEAPHRLGDFFDIHISARSPEVKSNPYVLEVRQNKYQKGWSSQKLISINNSAQTISKDSLKNYLPILNGRNLKSFKIDYDTNFSGYWIESDKVGTLKSFYLKNHIAVGHTKGGKVVAAIDHKKYPWISDVYLLLPKNGLFVSSNKANFLKEITYILNSPLMQIFMKTLYRDITPHTTLTQLKVIPIYPINKWKKLEEKYD